MPLRRHLRPGRLEIGVDEAGRGCLAGPVTAAAVVLFPGRRSPRDLDDSKATDAARRGELRAWIEANALAWAVGWASPAEIDAENILQASMTAMHRAIDGCRQNLQAALRDAAGPTGGSRDLPAALAARPRALLIDGHYFRPYPGLEHSCEVKGDARFQAIAAASVLAKTHRDERMRALHDEHPAYAWDSNKGYPTPPHRRALAEHGVTVWHRRSFGPVRERLLAAERDAPT